MTNMKSEIKDVVVDATYGILDTALPIGSLVKASIRLYKLSQQRRIREFAHAVIDGSPKSGHSNQELSGTEAEAFAALLQALVTDREDEKATLYADTFLYISQHNLFSVNRPMALYLIEAMSQLRATDLQLIREIKTFLDNHVSDEPRKTFFQRLELAKGDGISFDWGRRLSVQTLVHLGLLSRVHADMPMWTTEQYDIISRLVHGVDDDNKPLRSNKK